MKFNKLRSPKAISVAYETSKEQADAFILYETFLKIEICGFYVISIDNFGLNMLSEKPSNVIAIMTEILGRRSFV